MHLDFGWNYSWFVKAFLCWENFGADRIRSPYLTTSKGHVQIFQGHQPITSLDPEGKAGIVLSISRFGPAAAAGHWRSRRRLAASSTGSAANAATRFCSLCLLAKSKQLNGKKKKNNQDIPGHLFKFVSFFPCNTQPAIAWTGSRTNINAAHMERNAPPTRRGLCSGACRQQRAGHQMTNPVFASDEVASMLEVGQGGNQTSPNAKQNCDPSKNCPKKFLPYL